MKNWDEDDGTEYCTAADDLARCAIRSAIDSASTAHGKLRRRVLGQCVRRFPREYAAGRTPNPDVLCNREIKFRQFVDYATTLGADLIATGHYARTAVLEDGRTMLKKGIDADKDQTYFLQAVPIAELAAACFHSASWTKPAVRAIASRPGFSTIARKTARASASSVSVVLPISCPLPADEPGPILDPAGLTLGEHRGLAYYTLGQRQGLGIGGRPRPGGSTLVRVRETVRSNTLIVTQNARDLEGEWLAVADLNWLVPMPELPCRLNAKIRYRQRDQACTLYPRADGTLGVRFDDSQRAITPGQYACFYDNDICLGGGVIQAADTTTSWAIPSPAALAA